MSDKKDESSKEPKVPETTQTEPKKEPEPVIPTFTQAQVDEMLSKARKQEKDKLYSNQKDLKAKNKAAEDKLVAQTLESEERQKVLDELREGKLSELSTVNTELETLRQTNAALKEKIENVADVAARQVLDSRMEAYRKEQVLKAGLEMPELVPKGNSEEEIRDLVKKAKDRETEVFAKYKAAAEEKAQKKAVDGLPKPINITPDGKNASSSIMTPAQRRAIVRLPKAEFLKVRQKLLDEAEGRSTG